MEALFAEYNKQMKLVTERVYEGKPYYHGLGTGHLQMVVQILIGSLLVQKGLKPKLKCIGDKTPRYNLGLDTLHRFFPRAKYIHIVRDGRDVVASAMHHALRIGHKEVLTKGSEQHQKQIVQSARIWSQNVAAWRKFAGEHPQACVQISYEQLQEEPLKASIEVFQALGASADEKTVQACIDEASFKKLSGRDAGTEDKGSFFRKGVVGDWRNHFDRRDLELFMKNAGALMRELGYGVAKDAPPAGAS
jgi:hypothetical protein